MNNPIDIMIDIETISTRPNAIFTNLAAIKFDPFADNSSSVNSGEIIMDTFYRRVDPDSFTWDAHMDPSTIEWWSKQDELAIKEMSDPDDRHHVEDVLRDFYRWCGKPARIWANGAAFDTVIIESACRALDRSYPWEYWQVRDSRTIMKMVDIQKTKANLHHALWDCYTQIVDLQKAFKILNITQFAEDIKK